MKKTHSVYLIFMISLSVFNLKSIRAQNNIGINIGYNTGKYFESWKQKYVDFDSKYKTKIGYQLSFNIQKVNLKNKLRFELLYGLQKTHLEVLKNQGNGSSYKNLDYTFQYLEFSFDYSFNLISKNNKSLDLFFGPSCYYNLNTIASGNGWNFVSVLAYNSIGQPYYTMTTKDWVVSSEKSEDLSKLNLGVNFGINFRLPINKILDCIFENKNTLYLNNQTKLNDINPTAFIKSGISVGLRYRI